MHPLTSIFTALTICCLSCTRTESSEPTPEPSIKEEQIALARKNITRAMTIVAAAKSNYFSSSDYAMSRYYNPFTGLKSGEKASVWMYTSAIEAVNAILESITALKEAGDESFYDNYFSTYSQILSVLFDNLKWYEGTFTLTSYTQTKEWTVYGVNRSSTAHKAEVEGVMNVYDDQQWLIRELLTSYRLTSDAKYLEKAEYLASYVIDGWDTTIDDSGKEHGGIVWGPGYYTKHSCSNGPFISPLVWLYEIYKDSPDEISYRYIGEKRARLSKQMKKSDYYLMYARKVYDFMRTHLYNKSYGVYWDMLGAKGYGGDYIAYENVDGIRYRGYNEMQNPTGEFYSYNSGTMLSGAADLYGATAEQSYLDDLKTLSSSAFLYFAKKSASKPDYYEYDITGFNNWFNGVLLRGWIDAYPHYSNVSLNINTFQANLDYAWDNYLKDGMLPSSLLYGWNTLPSKNNTEGMFTFAFAAEYAVLAKWNLSK